MSRFAPVLLLLLLLPGCSDASRQSYLALSGRIFLFNPRVAEANYVVTLNVLKEPPTGSSVESDFANPAGGADLHMTQRLKPGQKNISFESQPLFCIKKDKRYAFKVVLKDGEGKLLQTIDSSIASTLDQSVLPDAPLVVGPGDDPNPALQNNEAGHALRKKAVDCPA